VKKKIWLQVLNCKKESLTSKYYISLRGNSENPISKVLREDKRTFMKKTFYKHIILIVLISVLLPLVVAEARVVKREKDITFIDTLYSVAMNGSNEVWCCGFNGSIYYSSDGGGKWIRQESHTKQTLFKIISIDAKKLVVCGQGGSMLHTDDGGKTWNQVDAATNVALMDMSFVDSRFGCAVGDQRAVLFSHDGGATWEKGVIEKVSGAENAGDAADEEFNPLLSEGDDADDEEFVIYSVCLASQNIGYAVGEFSTLLKTDDGGKTWIKSTIDEAAGKSLFGVFAQSPSKVWVVGIDGMMLLSEDGGNSWVRVPLPVKKHLFTVKFEGENGYVLGKEGIYLKSSDNGRTWKRLDIGAKFYLQGIELLKKTGWIVGAHGWLFETEDGGDSFSIVRRAPSLNR